MPVPASQIELLTAIEKTFAKLNQDLDRVPEHLARDLVLEGHAKGTMMSPADLVAYLIGWNRQVLLWHERRAQGLPDEFPASGLKWNQLGLLAQRYYAEYAEHSWTELRQLLNEAKSDIVSLVESYTDAELYGTAWLDTWTMGRMISFNTSSPYTNARGRIRSWLKTLES
jgi:hypothetical protein